MSHFAARLPGLDWQPSDIDPARRASVDAWIAAAGLANVAPAIDLDATRAGWWSDLPPMDIVLVVNLLHLLPTQAAWRVLEGMAEVAAPGGLVLIYGPFLRDGETTSEGDAAFDATLRARDPAIGYKDVVDVVARMVECGLRHVETRRMPANNLLLVAERPA